jgi:hypothetical protein
MGHSSIQVTYDLYGHLMPGSEEEAAGLLDAYLAAQRKLADERARAAEASVEGGDPIAGSAEPTGAFPGANG